GALAQLAQQQTREKFLFARRASYKKRGEKTGPLRARAATAGPGDLIERRIDFGQGQLGVYDIRSGSRCGNQRVADAALPLPGGSGEIRDADVDFSGCKTAQEFRHMGDLRPACSVLADMLRGIDEIGE